MIFFLLSEMERYNTLDQVQSKLQGEEAYTAVSFIAYLSAIGEDRKTLEWKNEDGMQLFFFFPIFFS